jgi:tetratricopeptide (TPR) repeat protein
MATSNSKNFAGSSGGLNPKFTPCQRLRWIRWGFWGVICLLLGVAWEAAGIDRATAAKRAEEAYLQMEKKYEENPKDVEVMWKLGRASFDWAEFAESASQRRHLAERGIAACRQALVLEPKLAAAQYYLAMNLGQLARAEFLRALKIIPEIDANFKAAAELDPRFDYAGAYRALGILYRDAPGWPASIGNRHKARQYLMKAVEVAPEYPENWLNLMEAYLGWGEKAKAAAQVAAVESKMEAARQQFTGPQWEWVWQDWEKQWQKIRSRVAARALESPAGRNR